MASLTHLHQGHTNELETVARAALIFVLGIALFAALILAQRPAAGHTPATPGAAPVPRIAPAGEYADASMRLFRIQY